MLLLKQMAISGFKQLNTVWTHGVSVYHGNGQGITAYHDGSKIGSATAKTSGNSIGGNGMVLIGRRYLTSDTHYVSTYVDEIKMYNRQLSESEIQNMY